MCTDCFKFVAGIALLDYDILTCKFIISFFTSSGDTKETFNYLGLFQHSLVLSF